MAKRPKSIETLEQHATRAGIAWIESEAALDCTDRELRDEAYMAAALSPWGDDSVGRHAYAKVFIAGAESMCAKKK